LAQVPAPGQHQTMTGLAVILLIVGIVLLLLGVFIEAAKFLLWIGIVIIIIAVIAWLMRFIRRQT
jgi:predicted lipid-binding transport protein (Tim44 family)